jgi:transposase
VAQKKGLSYKKARSLPAKANKKKQKEFLSNTLLPLIERAEKEEIELYFGDAVHLIWGATLGYCWCKERQMIKSAYGRKRFNVLGAIDSMSNKTITVSNDTYITSTQVAELFEKLRTKENSNKKIYIVLDNARYQKCQLVKDAAKKWQINIIYLPSYSPNLNLIERLWKFLRGECLNNKYYMTFEMFGNSILECLSKTHTEFNDRLSSLLSHKFDLF